MSNGGPTGNKVVSDLGKRLLEAARLGNTDEVSSLMTNGAPLTTDWLGTTPLHLASIYGHTSTAEILIKSGISKDGRTKVDKAPLHFACQHGHLGVVKLLVNDGAHVNTTDMLKMTPLHWAVESNSFEICLFLLKAGGKPDLKNKFNKTALNIASDKGYDTIVKLLSDEKFRFIQEIDVLHRNVLRDRQISSIQICRSENFNTGNNSTKKQKTRRFPMVAGTWTGGEAQLQERLEINEHKKLAIYKRRHQQRDNLAHSLLQNLQPVKMTSSIFGGKSKESDARQSRMNLIVSSDEQSSDDSPLVKLEQTVQLSTSNTDLKCVTVPNVSSKTGSSITSFSVQKCDINMNVDSISTSSLLFTLPHTSIEIPVVSSVAMQVGEVSDLPMKSKIPIVSSLSELPENVQAIPLNMTTTELNKLESQNKPRDSKESSPQLFGHANRSTGGGLIFSIPADHHLNSPATVIVPHALSSACNFENEPMQKSNTPVHLPVNILNQILDGNVTLLSLSEKTEGINDGQLKTLPGITTEMGTIPLIPVSGEGGLRLIPVEDRQSVSPPDSPTQLDGALCDDKSKLFTDKNIHVSVPASQEMMSPSLFVQQPARMSYPNFHMLMENHGGINLTGAVFANQSIPAGFINGAQIQSPVVMPTGIYLHPGQATLLPVQMHPAYIQANGQAYIQSTFVQPMLHPNIGQPILHPQPVFHTRQLPNLIPPVPQYVLMDKSNGVYSHQLQQIPMKSPPSCETFQEPDSSTEQ